MKRSELVSVLIATSMCWFAGGALAQDVGALEATFQAGVEALDARDLETAVAQADDDVVVFSLFSPFPIRGRAGFRNAVTEYFENYEEASFAPVSPQFRVLGASGLAWGYYHYRDFI